MINETLMELIVFLIAVFVHEFGHYTGYILFNRKPFFKFSVLGVIYADCEKRITLTLKQYFKDLKELGGYKNV